MDEINKIGQVCLERGDLLTVVNPARYTGGEWGSIVKQSVLTELLDTGKTDMLRVAFCFPDIYEIGMSNLALKILYHVLNQNESIWCERVFSPWPDLEAVLKQKDLPLFSLESHTAVSKFDVVAFTLQYELCYTNVLQILDLSKIPLLAKERKEEDPIVIGGGPITCNSEPITDFFDIFIIGEGEEIILEVMEEVRQFKLLAPEERKNQTRLDLLKKLAQKKGVYVPSFYQVDYTSKGEVEKITSLCQEAPPKIQKNIILDLDKVSFPTNPIVPHSKIIHDRGYLELFRGCSRGCRFCQAGFLYRPVREKSVQTLCQQGTELNHNTGYDEVGMLSLSTSDYHDLAGLTEGLLEEFEPHKTSMALPSLRVDSFSLDLLNKVSGTRKSGLTFAPEAGTQRLRDVINKGICEEDITQSLEMAFKGGWHSVKLYFMVGLPTETDEDVIGIVDLARKIERLYQELKKQKLTSKKPLDLTVSTSVFIPKPFTPFQWEAQASLLDMKRRQQILQDGLRSRNIKYIWHEASTALWEAVLARGDRRLNPVILAGYQRGYTFDAWDDFLVKNNWLELMEEQGLAVDFYLKAIDENRILPWDHVDVGVSKDFLLQEKERGYQGEITPPCYEACSHCGGEVFGGGICYAGK